MRPAILAAAFALAALPAHGQDGATAPELAEVEAIFTALYEQNCPRFDDEPLVPSEVFDLSVPYGGDDEAQPDQPLRVYQFFCFTGAYNANFVYFTWTELEGLQPLSLTYPLYDITWADEEETEVRSLDISGYVSRPIITNPTFDPETVTISAVSYWRGIGDASSGGVWRYKDGAFVLETFFVDATYDEEVNPETIVYFAPPQINS